ncbi:MAG: hypothetical protein NBV67_00330 [Tagaea sp.]|nr:hypothetical protein [Tagaea sp.]
MSDDTNGNPDTALDAKDALASLPLPSLPARVAPAPEAAPVQDSDAKPAKPKKSRKPKPNAAPPISEGAPPPIDATDARPAEAPPTGHKRDDAPPPKEKAGETVPPDCPVRPLGRAEGIYHFLTAAGEILSFKARDLAQANLAALFDGDTFWLRQAFPDWGKKSNDDIREAEAAGKVAPGFRVNSARDYFMRECAKSGIKNPYARLRATGSWRAANGDLILHLGDEVRRIAADGGGETRFAPGCEIDGKIYCAREAEPRPAEAPATKEDAALVHELLGLWNWRAPSEAPRLLLGWLCAGYLSGALYWNPHIYVTGDAGDGKTAFEAVLRAGYGLRAKRSADPSAAFIRQSMRGAARPVLVDEIENKDVGRRADDVIETARLASSADQAATGRGSAGGEAQEYELRGCFYFSSILHPPMKPQDLSRITIFDLQPLSADPTGEKKTRIVRGTAWLAGISNALHRRVIGLWPRIDEVRKKYELAIAKLDKKARVADQFGTMLALAHLVLDADPYDQDWIDGFVKALDLDTFVERDESESESQSCVSRLLSFVADTHSGGSRRTLGWLARHVGLGKNVGEGERFANQETLGTYGLRVERDLLTHAQLEAAGLKAQPAPGPWLVVAHTFDGLDAVFKGTRWERGVWNQALRRVPGAKQNPKRGVRVGGLVRKGMWLPLADIVSGKAWGLSEDIVQDDDDPTPAPPNVTGDPRDGYEGSYESKSGETTASSKP